MKKFICLLLCLFLIGCGNTNHVDLEKNDLETDKIKESIETKEEIVNVDDEKEIEVILKIMDFNSDSANDYVEKLKEENPDKKYSVYNDDYYCMTITEAERKEALKTFSDKKLVEEMFVQMYTDEIFEEAIKSIDYDDSFQNFTFYVDKEKYETNKFVLVLGIGIPVNAISDSYQAYNLILPEDRIVDIKFVDSSTGEVLSDEE